MKILLAAASYATSISGIQRHAINMARCLLLRPEISALHFVIAPWQCELAQAACLPEDARLKLHIADINRSSLSRNNWYYRQLPKLASQLQVELVHFSYPMPVNTAAFRCPTVVTLHDLYPYEIPMNFGFPKFLFNRIVLRQCLHGVDAIACVSDATRMRLKQYAPFSVWQKASRVYNCVAAEQDSPAQPPIAGWRKDPFLLCVAQHRKNKNIPTLIRAFDRLLRSDEIDPRLKLVVIGMGGPESEAIRHIVIASGLAGSVHFLEGIAEAELQWCYRHCEALVAPSLTEGFGLPVAEGLLAGCRIVCSDIPAHREIGEGHCLFVSLREYAVGALAAAIADALNEPRREPISLPQLSAPVLADQYLALYCRVATSPECTRNTQPTGSIHVAASESGPL